jgi:thioredoxin-like negative regulator of GroEL
MDRVLVLAAVALGVAALVLAGRTLASRRLRRLTAGGQARLWTALGADPDGRPTVVVFSTPSCAACWTAQKPALAALEERTSGGVRVIQIDAAARPDVARTFGIMTVPSTVVLDRRGDVVAANQGFATADRLAGQVGGGLV